MLTFFNSLGVVNSLALLSVLAIVIPVVIHLINPSKGKRIIIGSISLVKRAKISQVSELKIAQLILLALRVLMLLLLALLLAQLYSESTPPAQNKSVYITQNWLANSSNLDRQSLIDLHKGGSLFLVGQSINELSMENINREAEAVRSGEYETPNWPLLIETFENSVYDETIDIYATDSKSEYWLSGGAKPPTFSTEVKWHISHEEMTNEIDVEQLNIIIVYDSDYQEDLNYLTEAFNKLNRYRNISIEATQVNIDDFTMSDLTDGDWLFWISSQNIPSFVTEGLQNSYQVFLVANKNRLQPLKLTTEIDTFPYSEIRLHNAEELTLEQYDRTVWASQDGRIILSRKIANQIYQYHFASTFSKEDSNLTQLVEFPLILSSLLYPDLFNGRRFEHGYISFSKQEKNGGNINSIAPKVNQALEQYLIFFIILLFILERLYAEQVIVLHRTNKNTQGEKSIKGEYVES